MRACAEVVLATATDIANLRPKSEFRSALVKNLLSEDTEMHTEKLLLNTYIVSTLLYDIDYIE